MNPQPKVGAASAQPPVALNEAGRPEVDQAWQALLSRDPDYFRFLHLLEAVHDDEAGRRADAYIQAGADPF